LLLEVHDMHDMMVRNYRPILRCALFALVLTLLHAAAVLAQIRIIQTNSRGDNVHLIDPATQSVVGEIKGVPVNHGAAAAPDGSRLYVTSEAKHSVEVIDSKSLKPVKSIPLSGRPNNITITPNGRKLYVAIRSEPGAIDVIDTVALQNVKTIPTDGGMHNTYATPDGKHIIAGATGGQHMLVLDAVTDEPLWRLFDRGVRPIAIEKRADGSTHRLFVQLTNLHGFAIVDFVQRKEIGRVTLPDVPVDQQTGGSDAPSHGIGIAPDGKTLWVNTRRNNYVYVYSLPNLEYLGGVKTPNNPNWLTFSPDSKYVYVACSGANEVTVIDVQSRTKVAAIPAGPNPQRNITAVLR
jgi:YVTN family beta-propeller protein